MNSKVKPIALLAIALSAVLSLCPSHLAVAQEPPGPPPEVWLAYHDHQRLSSELADLAAAFPNLIQLESIGQSAQGRDIWLVTITNQDLPGDKTKVFFDGSMHGSEVIAAESMLHYIKFLVEQYNSNPAATEIVDGWITYVVPMVNPDGVEAGKNSDDYRLARKNAHLVDLNRNLTGTGRRTAGPTARARAGPPAFSILVPRPSPRRKARSSGTKSPPSSLWFT